MPPPEPRREDAQHQLPPQNRLQDAPPPWPLLEHELRGAVGALSGLIRLLADGRVPAAEQARVMASLQHAAERAATLARDVGQIARWSRTTGTGETRQSVRLSTLLELAVSRGDAEANPVPLEIDSDGDLRLSVLDSDAVAHAFSSLVRAALRGASGEITCRARVIDSRVDVLIAPAAVSWIAESDRHPFEVVSRSGLGLSVLLAAMIIEAHQGRLFQDESGTAIGVMLPITATR